LIINSTHLMDRKIFKKFGYFKDQEGIINRFIRESGGWDSHLLNTKRFIEKSAENRAKSKVLILGSGWCLDIPIEKLSGLFSEVVLIDIKHPGQIVHKLRNYPNIRFMEEDIGGFTEPTYHVLQNYKNNGIRNSLNDIKPVYSENLLNQINTSDYIVSVNLLNQLDILICDYIIDSERFSEQEILSFRKYIQSNHLQLLPKNKSVLITDYEELNYDKQEQLVSRKNLIHINLTQNESLERWTWDFDLHKNYRPGLKTVFRVMALEV